MEPLVWWVLLIGLIILITALSLLLCFGLLSDKIKTKLHLVNSSRSRNPQPHSDSNFKKLTRYQFQKTDVEDLTSIEKNLADFHPQISFVNEFGAPQFRKESTSSGSPRSVKKRKASLLTDVHESIEAEFGSFYSLEDIMEDLSSEKEERKGDLLPRRFSLVTEGMRRNSSAALPRRFSLKPEDGRTDTLNHDDPLTIETSASIAQLDDQARRVEYEIDYFLGNSKNLKFYELNEKLIRLSLTLSELECGHEELRRQKKVLQAYIAHCKHKLSSKVG